MLIVRVLFILFPALVILIDGFLIYTVGSIFKLSGPHRLAISMNVLLYLYFVQHYFKEYRPQFILLAFLFILFVCSLPRTPSPDFVTRWTIFQSYIGVFLAFGSLFRLYSLQFFFTIYVAIHAILAIHILSSHSDQVIALNPSIVIPASIYFGALLVEILKLHFLTMEAGGYRISARRVIDSIIEPFRGLGWVEWLGILVSVLSLLRLISGTEVLDRLLGSLYRLFIGFYKNTVEIVPDFLIDEVFFYFFDASPPTWLTPIVILLGIFLRCANLHSNRYEETPIWNIILGKIIYPSGDLDFKGKTVSGFSGVPFEISVNVFNFMIVTSILSILNINPIQWLAPRGGVSIESIIFVCIAGFISGILLKQIMSLPYHLNGIRFIIVIIIIIIFRTIYYGPALIFISPFVAWRILIITFAMSLSLLLLSSGIDLVRPSVSPIGGI